jgi:hypothetical protein
MGVVVLVEVGDRMPRLFARFKTTACSRRLAARIFWVDVAGADKHSQVR